MPQAKQPARSNKAPAATRRGTFLPRLGVTFLTALGLGALFAVYCLATRPLRAQPTLQRLQEETQQQAAAISDDQPARIAKQFLPEHPWAASAKNHATSVDKLTYWYFQVWKQESPNVISLEPFALVSKRKTAKPGDRPYSVASDKAYITFASKVSLMGGSPGAIVRAELEGAVLIEGPNNLRINGRNFYFQKGDPNIVYSDDNLSFRADRHFGSAKGMQLELLRDEKAKPDEPIAIGGLSTVKLLQNVDMTLVSNSFEQAISSPAGTRPTPSAAHGSQKPQPVRCQSVGSFTFVMATHEATFERNVRIRRETTPGKFDFIAADDVVKIVFDAKKPLAHAAPPAAANAKDQSQASGSGTFDPNLSFKELHAHGKDVSLISQSNGLKALELHDLDYDRVGRQAKLSAAPNRVQISHNEDRLQAPYIQIDHDESGQEVTQIWCRGAGDMRHTDEKTKEVDLAAEWKKEMRKYADPHSSFDIVDLDEGAMIEQPKEYSGILADHISLYLVRQHAEQHTARPNMPPAPKRAQTAPQLDHLIAIQKTEKVAMVSKQLEAESKRLEIWFQDGPATAPNESDGHPRLRANLQPTSLWVADAGSAPEPTHQGERPSVAGHPESPVATKPAKSSPAGTLLPQSGDSTEPYVMKADEICVRVNRGTPGVPAQVANVVAKGLVHLTQAQKDGALPLMIDGDLLEVENRGPLDQEMVVHGQPGHVRNRGSHIEGNRIVFDRGQNTSDVDGAGKLQLPVKQSSEPGQPERTTPFDVSWLTKMHFDGQTALFTGTVHSKMDDGQEATELRCREMGVTLTKPFSFSQQNKGQEQPEIETIDCYGGVEFNSTSTLDHKLMEDRQGAFAQLHFHKPSGRSKAKGPGRLDVWRHNENGQSGLSQFSNVQSNSPPKTKKHTPWEYMQVKFDGTMDGDFKQMLSPPPSGRPKQKPQVAAQRRSNARTGSATNSILGANGAWTTVFHDHVEVLYGPVEQRRETVCRDDLQEQSGWLGCDSLRVDQHPQDADKDQHLTLLASGDSKIEGKDFFGEAETISYDGSKTLYVLRGDGNRLARLWRQLRVGAEPTNSNSNQIFFDPVHQIVRQDSMSNLDLIQ